MPPSGAKPLRKSGWPRPLLYRGRSSCQGWSGEPTNPSRAARAHERARRWSASVWRRADRRPLVLPRLSLADRYGLCIRPDSGVTLRAIVPTTGRAARLIIVNGRFVRASPIDHQRRHPWPSSRSSAFSSYLVAASPPRRPPPALRKHVRVTCPGQVFAPDRGGPGGVLPPGPPALPPRPGHRQVGRGAARRMRGGMAVGEYRARGPAGQPRIATRAKGLRATKYR